MSELTNALVENQRNLERIGGLLKLRESAATSSGSGLKLSDKDIKSMRDNSACPCCGKRLTALEVEHLAGGETSTSESARGAAGGMQLRESQIQTFMKAFSLTRAGAERMADGRKGRAA